MSLASHRTRTGPKASRTSSGWPYDALPERQPSLGLLTQTHPPIFRQGPGRTGLAKVISRSR